MINNQERTKKVSANKYSFNMVKNNIKVLPLILFFIFAAFQTNWATNYYIDASNGNDSNNGTSESSPWKTISKLQSSWNLIKPGDSILLKAGERWAPSSVANQAIMEIPFGLAGNADAYITIGSYGSGNKPVISTKNLGGKYAFLSGGCSYIIFQDLEFRGNVEFQGVTDDGHHHLKFLRDVFDGNASGDATDGYILFNPGRSESSAENWSFKPVHDLEFGYCEMKNLYGMHFYAAEGNIWVHDNKFYNSQTELLDFGGGDNITIEYNLFSGAGTHGIKVQPQAHTVKNLIIRGNLIIGSQNHGMLVLNAINPKIYNNTIKVGGTDEAAAFGWVPSNPIYICGKGTTGFQGGYIQNNIFEGGIVIHVPDDVQLTYKDGTSAHYHQDEIWVNNHFQNNIINGNIIEYKYKAGTSVYWDGSAGKYNHNSVFDLYTVNFSTWTSNTNVTNDLSTDPQFVNDSFSSAFSYGDFHLKSSSPAKGSGISVTGYTKDLDGKSIPSSNPDRGAFQSGTSQASDVTPPTVTGASITNATTVVVNFSETVNTSDAQNKSNYSISGGISVSSAALSNGNKVTLTTSQHQTNQNYTVTVSNVKDAAGNAISSSNTATYKLSGPAPSTGVTVNAKVFLQGPFENGSMATALQSSNVIPLSQPYSAAPWNYGSRGSNLIKSGAGDFESSTGNWHAYGSNTVQVSSDVAATGSKSLKITYVDHSFGAYLYLNASSDLSTDLTAGKKYRITFSGKVNTGSALVSVYLGNTNDPVSTTLSTTMQQHTLEFTAASASEDFVYFNQMSSGKVVYLDNLQITEVGTSSSSETVENIPANVVDWVLVELRTGTAAGTVAAKRAAFIKNDGSIVDVDGTSKVNFSNVNSGNYYIVIKHRNHLAVMSANPVALSSSSSLYDFTTGENKAYGTTPMADLGNGTFGMYAGDGDHNGTINVLDYGTVGNSIFETGYKDGDLDMNNVVNVLDYGKTSNAVFQASQVPN